MKVSKMLSVCLSILLASMTTGYARNAQFIDERFPKTHQATFSSNTGKVTFNINAVIETPHVTDIPLYNVSMRLFTPEEVKRLADHMLSDNQCLYNDNGQWTDTTEGNAGISRKNEIYYISQDATRSMDAFNDWGSYVSGYYSTIDDTVDLTYLLFMHTLPMDGVFYNLSGDMGGDQEDKLLAGNQIPGNHYTLDEAQALADGAISQIAPDLKLVSVCTTEASFNYSEEDVARHNDPNDPFTIDPALVAEKLIPGYVFTYTREIDNIAVTYTTTTCHSPESYGLMSDYEKCFVLVGNRGIEYVGYSNPMQCDDIIAPSCELLSFSDIESVVRSVMPIMYDAIYSSPFYTTVAFEINRITLGYMRVKVKDAAHTYQLIPVWDFFGTGEYTYDDHTVSNFGLSPNNSLFTINAIDGTVIDRSYGY